MPRAWGPRPPTLPCAAQRSSPPVSPPPHTHPRAPSRAPRSEGGQLNGNLIVALRETVIQQLAGNAPTTIRRADQALYSEYACGTLARLGDFCQGILTKIDTGVLLEIVLIFVLIATVASLAYFSWLTHQLRWNLLQRSDDNVRVGPYGCLLTEDGLAWSWKGWTRDPCAYITVMAAAGVFAVPFGLIGWVVGVDLLRFRWQIGLLGAFAGLDNGQFVQGIRGVQFMNAGYNMFALTLVCLVIAIVGGVLVRESFRAMIYGDVDKAMGDITSSAMGKSVAVLERWGGWWYNLVSGPSSPQSPGHHLHTHAPPHTHTFVTPDPQHDGGRPGPLGGRGQQQQQRGGARGGRQKGGKSRLCSHGRGKEQQPA